MGLIKTAENSIKSTFADQWKRAIRCENMDSDVLMMKKTAENGVIANKSIIVVAPGQCAVIYDNGRVIDATAEDGYYVFDTSSTPSFFAGDFGATFKEMWTRFTFEGERSKEQAVFFFNIREIIDNKFGTAAPIPFQDWSHPIPNQMTNTLTPLRVQIKCFGKYTFKIVNPALFMKEIAGTANIYRKGQLNEQIRAEVIAAFQNIVNELGNSNHKVPVLEMPSQTDEIKQIMDEQVFDEPIRRRGIAIQGFAVESVTLDEESKQKIDNYELSSNSYMQQGKLVDAYANAVQGAATNENGAMNGFMGIGMMNMSTNGMVGGAVKGVWENTQNSSMDLSKEQQNAQPEEKPEIKDIPQTIASSGEWTCECGEKNSSKFCGNCGKPRQTEKKCSKCGTINDAKDKFCGECGEKL